MAHRACLLLLLQVPPEFADRTDVPDSFICPITHNIMRQPAVLLSGATYERDAITTWLASARYGSMTTEVFVTSRQPDKSFTTR